MAGENRGEPPAGKRRATLRGRTASLTSVACSASFNHHGGHAGEGAR
ncbi:DUF6380 family protein [Streptomyces sp. NPDC093094]